MYKSSELIRIAVGDLKKVLASPKHEIDMNEWIQPTSTACYVCLAGAVLINTLGYDDNHMLNIGEQPDEVQDIMIKLNDLRKGYIEDFLDDDASKVLDDILDHQIDPFTYADDGARFIEQLDSLATKLEAHHV